MVLQRDQVKVWERHIKNAMLTRLNVSALIWGTLAELGLQMIWSILLLDGVQICLLGRVTGPWDTSRKAISTTVLQMGPFWIGCKRGSAVIFVSDQMLNICMKFVSSSDAKVGRLFCFLISHDNLLISTSDFKSLFFVWFLFSKSTQCLQCL